MVGVLHEAYSALREKLLYLVNIGRGNFLAGKGLFPFAYLCQFISLVEAAGKLISAASTTSGTSMNSAHSSATNFLIFFFI